MLIPAEETEAVEEENSEDKENSPLPSPKIEDTPGKRGRLKITITLTVTIWPVVKEGCRMQEDVCVSVRKKSFTGK